MIANRQTLEAGVATLFEFDEFYYRSILVKNMTAGAIEFCEGTFDTSKSAVIPAYGWQLFNLTIPYSSKPKFYVKARSAGDVEIDFGSDGMGIIDAYTMYNAAGMLPYTLAFSAVEGTTLTATLIRLHGQSVDLDTPVTLATGATVYTGDVVEFETAGANVVLMINGEEVELDEDKYVYKIVGDTVAELVEGSAE
jgi:hypothetical protein